MYLVTLEYIDSIGSPLETYLFKNRGNAWRFFKDKMLEILTEEILYGDTANDCDGVRLKDNLDDEVYYLIGKDGARLDMLPKELDEDFGYIEFYVSSYISIVIKDIEFED